MFLLISIESYKFIFVRKIHFPMKKYIHEWVGDIMPSNKITGGWITWKGSSITASQKSFELFFERLFSGCIPKGGKNFLICISQNFPKLIILQVSMSSELDTLKNDE